MNSHLNHQLGLDLDILEPNISFCAILLRMLWPQESPEPANGKITVNTSFVQIEQNERKW
jgi:hypothetical protein